MTDADRDRDRDGRRERRDAGDHLGTERGRQGHHHRRDEAADARARVPLRRDLHDPGEAPRRGRRRRLPLPRQGRRSRRSATPASSSRRTRSTAIGMGRRAARCARRSRRAATSILKIDVQGAQVVKEKIPGALLVFLIPPSLEDLFLRLRSRATETADELELRQRNAAIELARQEDYDYVVDQRDRAGRTDRRADRRDHRRGASTPPGPTGRRLPALAVTLSEASWGEGPADRAKCGIGVGAAPAGRRGRGRRRAAGTGHTPISSPERLRDLELGEAVLVEFGRRQALGIVLAEASGLPAAATKPIVDRVRADGPLLPAADPAAGPLDLRPLSRAAGSRAPVDAAARAARATRARGRAGAGRFRRAARYDGRRPPRPARARPASGPRPGRTRRSGGPAPSPPGARGGRDGQPRVGASRCRGGTALRALDPADRRRSWRRSCPRRGGRPARPAARSAPGRGAHRAVAATAGRADDRRPTWPAHHGHAAVAGLVRRGLADGRRSRASPPTARRSGRPGGAAGARRAATCCPAQAEAVERIRAAIAAARSDDRSCSMA